MVRLRQCLQRPLLSGCVSRNSCNCLIIWALATGVETNGAGKGERLEWRMGLLELLEPP